MIMLYDRYFGFILLMVSVLWTMYVCIYNIVLKPVKYIPPVRGTMLEDVQVYNLNDAWKVSMPLSVTTT